MQQAPVLIGSAQLPGVLSVPTQARGLVVFAHGSGSSRHSPRNQHVAAVLQAQGLATLLFDLLDAQEGQDRRNVFNITLLARRLADAVDWAGRQQALAHLPLGLFGAVGALAITGNSLSFTAVIGIIALMGIEIKNSILLVDFTEQLRREGVPLREAIERAGEVRFLPVLLTSVTAIGGLIPLALERSGLYSPLAIAIIGGLISSTLLSRIATPVLYWLATRGEEKVTA